MKQVISTLLAMIMLLTMLPFTEITAFAATSGDYEYSVLSEKERTCEITKYIGEEPYIVIPSTLDGYTVMSIGDYAFGRCTSLKNITIPDSVTSIGNNTFFSCDSLTSITIPDSVTSIGDGAFGECSSLTSIAIPNSVTIIGYGAFRSCVSLTNIDVSENNTLYSSENGVLFNKDKTELLQYPAGKTDGTYNVPDTVISIGDYAFYGCDYLANIEIPNSVTIIGDDTFCGCTSLTSITIPDSVTSIGDGAFGGCSSLTSIAIPNSVTSIGDGAFGGCTSLTSITIPDGVTRIGTVTFHFCESLTSVEIPSSVTSIEYRAFSGCTSLTSITIPDRVTSIGEEAFASCYSLASMEIPDSVTSIENRAFMFCESFKSITIPDSVTSIGEYVFLDCTSLESVTILDSVMYIGEDAFLGCGALTIYGYSGSYVETYANENELTFIALPKLEDADSKVIVEALDFETLPEKAELNVETVETTDSKAVYDITLTVDGEEIQPNGEVTVKILLPEGIDGLPYEVYREEEDGTLTSMNAMFQYGYLVFTTDHFSRYIVTLRSLANPGDVDGNGEIDDWDSVLLDRYLAGWDVGIDTLAADIDGSGEVDDWDSVLLARKLAGWDD